jgi:hypothetical protein
MSLGREIVKYIYIFIYLFTSFRQFVRTSSKHQRVLIIIFILSHMTASNYGTPITHTKPEGTFEKSVVIPAKDTNPIFSTRARIPPPHACQSYKLMKE